ncbi:MAG: tripartite tricarboxylate transporter substrate binding protein [Betaproteobacteria bacterium]|nr:tripartite tricarboxylate transporter substrate binding protein [Betaproteobacteria bacterium]
MRKTALCRIALAAALAFSLAAQAQDYPSRPIKIIAPVPPGLGLDTFTRVVADKLREKWGQPVIVENRAGAGGHIGGEATVRAAPDGYTLLFAAHPQLVVHKSLYAKLPYDPDAFEPVSVLVKIPVVLVAHAKIAADSVQQLIGLAKDNPDRLTYASNGSGGTPHLAAEWFKTMVGVKILHVPYKSNTNAVTDMLGARVDMMFLNLDAVLPHIRAGKLRALAMAGDKRDALLPDTPTMSEVLPGFVLAPWWGAVAPPKTPAAIANKISAAVAEILKQPEMTKRLFELGNIGAVGSTPAEMALFMKQERERWAHLVRVSGAKEE